MRFAGIDIARRTHVVAIADDASALVLKPTSISDDAGGYAKLVALLGPSTDVVVVMEATGHYWRNLFAYLCGRGFPCAVVNPLRVRRFAREDLRRAKTDRTDAVTIARFGSQKRPEPSPPPDRGLDDLRELVQLHRRLSQDFTDRLRQLHCLLVLVFPEFTQVVRTLDSQRATALLSRYPSARAFRDADAQELAGLRCGARGALGAAKAASLVGAATTSAAQHHGAAYDVAVRVFCADLNTLRRSLRELEAQIDEGVRVHTLAAALRSIDGLGTLNVGILLARLGDPAYFRNGAALAAYVGVVPAISHSGQARPGRAPISPLGKAEVRAALWMPTLAAIRHNPWLRAYDQRLVARGKPRKLAIVASMRKLLTAIYAVAKSRRPFVPHAARDA